MVADAYAQFVLILVVVTTTGPAMQVARAYWFKLALLQDDMPKPGLDISVTLTMDNVVSPVFSMVKRK